MNLVKHLIWDQAPNDAWAWERYPNGKCVWHCKHQNGTNFTKSAPNFESKKNTLWKCDKKQKEADACKPIFPPFSNGGPN